MKFKLFLIILIISFSFGFSNASADQNGCSSLEGFVWSRVSGRCVQAICPNDSIGRDTSGDCVCSGEREPRYKDRKLVACIKPVVQIEENIIDTDPVLDSNVVETVPGVGVQENATTSSKKETRTSSAMPNTITLIVIVALGIGFWLYRLAPLKK